MQSVECLKQEPQQVQIIQLQISKPKTEAKSRLHKFFQALSRWMSWEFMSRQK